MTVQNDSRYLEAKEKIDGILRDVIDPSHLSIGLHNEVISRIKVLSGLRTDEHLLPQDGRFKVKIEDFGEVDVRVSIVPTYYGENAILRVLAQTQSYSLEDMGFSVKDLQNIKNAISKPYGMILANGPTGSGKTVAMPLLATPCNASFQ